MRLRAQWYKIRSSPVEPLGVLLRSALTLHIIHTIEHTAEKSQRERSPKHQRRVDSERGHHESSWAYEPRSYGSHQTAGRGPKPPG